MAQTFSRDVIALEIALFSKASEFLEDSHCFSFVYLSTFYRSSWHTDQHIRCKMGKKNNVALNCQKFYLPVDFEPFTDGNRNPLATLSLETISSACCERSSFQQELKSRTKLYKIQPSPTRHSTAVCKYNIHWVTDARLLSSFAKLHRAQMTAGLCFKSPG